MAKESELTLYQRKRAKGLCGACGLVKSRGSKCDQCSRDYSEWQTLNRGHSNKARAERLARFLLLEVVVHPPKHVVKALAEEICSCAARWIKDNCS